MFAYDIVICSESKAEVEERLKRMEECPGVQRNAHQQDKDRVLVYVRRG